jgi:hypothetical protein
MSQFDCPITPTKKKEETMEGSPKNKRFYFEVSIPVRKGGQHMPKHMG